MLLCNSQVIICTQISSNNKRNTLTILPCANLTLSSGNRYSDSPFVQLFIRQPQLENQKYLSRFLLVSEDLAAASTMRFKTKQIVVIDRQMLYLWSPTVITLAAAM